MQIPEQARRWQATLDHDFPHGVVASFEDSPDASAVHSPRAEVVRMAGLDPVVFLAIPAFEHSVTARVGDYAKVQDTPHFLARVTLVNHGGRKMLWSAGLSPYEVQALAPARARSLELSARNELYMGGRP